MKSVLGAEKAKNIIASVIQVIPLTRTILQVFLELPEPLSYQAGQYLKVVMNDGQQIPLSIANAPLGGRRLELHIRHTPENPSSVQLLSSIQQQGILNIVAPFGQCTVVTLKSEYPVIFMARGSGFAPIKAIIEQLLATGFEQPIHLYWGFRNMGDQYLDELPQTWTHHLENFQYTPVLCPDELHPSCSQSILAWNGRFGDLMDVIITDYVDLSPFQILAAGPFDMILKARDQFMRHGLKVENMYSDAFSVLKR